VSRRARRSWAGAIGLLAVLVLLTPRAEDPDSTLAFRRYLSNMGFEVSDAASPPPPGGTLILLDDLRGADEANAILRWVEQGGRLVVADPNSGVLPLVGAIPAGPMGFVGNAGVAPACLAPEAVGVGTAVIRASDVSLQATEAGFVSCFPAEDGSFLLTRHYGSGTVTLLGGSSPLTTELLTAGDNAVLALQIATPGRQVVFGPPLDPGAAGSADLWDLVPEPARIGGVAMILSVLAFAVVRARRLGPPVLEDVIAPIPASELVRATSRMYRRARAAAYSGRLLRQAALARYSRRRGGAPGGADDLVTSVSHASGVPAARVKEILDGPAPRSDQDLIQLGRELEELASQARENSR
jgi:hypothetical protein